MSKKAVVIGAGFSGLTAATALASKGFEVRLLEKHMTPGGRARVFKKDGFTFDMGPSWYWMPEVFEQFFSKFGNGISGPELKRLDPSYQVIFSEGTVPIPADYTQLKQVFESIEPGSAAKLDVFLDEAREKYETAMGKFISKPCLSVIEFLEPDIMRSAFRLNLLSSFSSHVRKYFRSPQLLQLLEFPILFLGALPKDIPALYSMMNYADIKLGTWYPMGGFGKVIEGMAKTAESNGAKIHLGTEVLSFDITAKDITSIRTSAGTFEADVVISSADYNFTEKLLPQKYRNYKDKYWDRRVMAPSCLLYYIGINKKLPRLLLLLHDNSQAGGCRARPRWV